jgi:hypothetical protein
VTGEARRLLLAAVDATGGVSWGARFHRIVDALEDSGCVDLLDVLHAAAQLDDRAAHDAAWDELLAAVDRERGDGLVALDLVVEIGQRLVTRAGGCREWSRGDESLARFAEVSAAQGKAAR